MLSKYLIDSDATLIQALEKINALSGGAMTLFAIEKDGRVAGTLTDGDIRRAILAGKQLHSTVAEACKRDFRHINTGDADPALLRKFRNDNIRLIPVLDTCGRLCNVIDLVNFRTVLPLRAILMAGGKGERLRPATLTTPKPLLEIEGKAIIDYNIEALAACGITDITVCTRYLAEQIEEHFASPVAGVNVKCVREDIPLGTIGAVTLTGVANLPGDTLVMNSDLLTTISFEEMFITHRKRNAAATIAAVPYQVSVPYAILTTSGDNSEHVSAIEEKPSYSYYANAGIYIFRNEILSRIPKDTRYDATDLIQNLIDNGLPVTYYPIKGTWIDVGSPVDFRQAGELMRHHNALANS
ncbi:MAG: NTP transferase domain-containing protein [Muribaculaceae bacterium]|nr:NTP transferase domain-containing protein [Muribaculaceae bacterium]